MVFTETPETEIRDARTVTSADNALNGVGQRFIPILRTQRTRYKLQFRKTRV